MTNARIQANEAQKNTEPARQPRQEPVRQAEQGPLQAVAPQAAYRRAQVNGNGLMPSGLLSLQCTIGNRTTQRLIAARAQCQSGRAIMPQRKEAASSPEHDQDHLRRSTAFEDETTRATPPALEMIARTAIQCKPKEDGFFSDGQLAARQEQATSLAGTSGALVQRQGAGAISPNPDPRCKDLLQQIRDFIFGNENMKGLVQRAQELIEDLQGLQWDFWTTPHTRYGSIEGHQQQFRNMQQGLRNRLDEWNSRTCDDPDGPSQLPERTWEWATRPAPVPTPRPRPSAPEVEGEGISWSRVLDVLAAIGLTIAMAAVVIAALADPEPATKLALAGLSVVMISKVLQAFGKDGQGQTT